MRRGSGGTPELRGPPVGGTVYKRPSQRERDPSACYAHRHVRARQGKPRIGRDVRPGPGADGWRYRQRALASISDPNIGSHGPREGVGGDALALHGTE